MYIITRNVLNVLLVFTSELSDGFRERDVIDNIIPNDKHFQLSTSKAFVENKLGVVEMMDLDCERVEKRISLPSFYFIPEMFSNVIFFNPNPNTTLRSSQIQRRCRRQLKCGY